jgi:hypothetical protein
MSRQSLADDGHWVINYNDDMDCVGVVCLYQDTQTHGISLTICGEFKSGSEKIEYCGLLCQALNREDINIPSTELERTPSAHIFFLKNGLYHDVWDNRVHIGNYAWFDEVQQFAGVADTFEDAEKAISDYCKSVLGQQ